MDKNNNNNILLVILVVLVLFDYEKTKGSQINLVQMITKDLKLQLVQVT